MKFKEGKNRFRVLSKPVVGWEYWTEDNKPVRSKELWNVVPLNARLPWDYKHFWAFIVWNLDDERIQILEITQKGILERLQGLIENEHWGDPREYTLTITREGEGLKTRYVVDPSPHKKTPAEVTEKYKETDINLEELFVGGQPFKEETEENFDDSVPF